MYVTVEGDLDVVVARRILEKLGIVPYRVDAEGGKTRIKSMMPKICAAAKTHPWFVLVDLDSTACASALVAEFTGGSAAGLVLRVAVREVEAWLLADRSGFASFFGVSPVRVPVDPEVLPDPKQALVNICRHSRKRQIKEGVVPDPASLRKTGAEYNFLLGQFVTESWDIDAAAAASQSLRRCLAALA